MIQTPENSEKPNFGPDLDLLGPNSGHHFFFFFFFKNLAALVIRFHGQLSCTISEKTNNPILRKLSDRRTDGQTTKWTDRWTRVIS